MSVAGKTGNLSGSDPKGRYEDRAFFCTQEGATAEEVLCIVSQRWALEVTFRDPKQHLGLEDPQNGFRRRKRRHKGPRKPGPQHRGRKGVEAVTRTAPTILIAYGLTWLWYLNHGDATGDTQISKSERPWYQQKAEPSYEDILRAVRRALARAGVSADPLGMRIPQNTKAAPLGATQAA